MSAEAGIATAFALTPDGDGRLFIGQGPKVQEFEKAFASLVGLETPLTTNSCTSALDLALHLAGVGLGDEVITTPMTCTATNSPIVNRKAKIVWADVDPVTGLIDPADVARKMTRRTKAIMAVDWAGRSCDYKALRSLTLGAPWMMVPIIQDAAHNLMVDPNNRGDYVAWSFQAIKHLTTVDGGALLVPEKQYERAKLLRWYGLDRESSADFRCAQNIIEAGYKYHMNDVNAAIGLANLPSAEWVVSRHRENARWYSDNLRAGPDVLFPPADDKGSWWLYTLRVRDQAGFIKYMAEQGVMTGQVHARNDTHKAFDYYNGPLPGVDEFSSHQVAIPVGWWVTERDREHIAEAVAAFSWARV
jgi:dTDP-4-amino-4,6-dideoxygalactose transaminase